MATHNEVLEFVQEQPSVSHSLLQRTFRISRSEAEAHMQVLESSGVVGPQNGARPRPVLKRSKEAVLQEMFDELVEEIKDIFDKTEHKEGVVNMLSELNCSLSYNLLDEED